MRTAPRSTGSSRPSSAWINAAACGALLALLGAGPLAAEAPARVFRPCGPGVDCGRVLVPLDRAGRAPGSIRLAAIRVRARSHRATRPRDAVVALSGGPGESAIPFIVDFLGEMYPALATRDLLVFDQRGTGVSSPIRCPRYQQGTLGGGGIPAATTECAKGLGPAVQSYNTEEAARDIEAVRIAAGARKLTLYGVSYGTKVAMVYAALYPDRVERLVLDSVVDPQGADPFDLDLLGAVSRVMRDACAGHRCNGVTGDPVADLQTLVGKLARAPLAGYVVGGDGRRRARQMGRGALLDLLVEWDYDPSGRATIPGAVRSALNGDPEPLLRLVHLVLGQQPSESPRLFDVGTFVATSCADQGFPWSPASSPASRWADVFTAAQQIPDSAFAPFDRATAQASALLRICAFWPPVSQAPLTPVGPLPDVPTLIFSGSADLRTPTEAARSLAARQPHSSLLVVPGAGHAVLPSDLSGCADRAVRQFFADRPVSQDCPRSAGPILRLLAAGRADPIAPAALGEVDSVRGLPPRIGRTVRAAVLTLIDLSIAETLTVETSRVTRIGGLRGGRALIRGRRERLERYSYVPGVAVSAPYSPFRADALRLRVTGRAAARGTLRFDFGRNRIHGHLSGRRIGLRLSRQASRAVRGLYGPRLPSLPGQRRGLARLRTPVS